MSQPPPPLPAASAEQVDALSRAVRFVVCAVVLGVSCFNILSALSIGKFAAIFNDMLAGHPLPTLTAMVLTLRSSLLVLSLLIPIAAVALVFVRRLTLPIYCSAALAFVAVVQLFVTNLAMFLPLTEMMKQMSSAG